MIKNIITIGILAILTGCAGSGHVSTAVVYEKPPTVILESRPIMIYPIYRHPHYYHPIQPPIYRPPIHRLPPPVYRIPPTINPPRPNIAPRIEKHR